MDGVTDRDFLAYGGIELTGEALDPSSISNDILKRAVTRVREESKSELLPAAHHTHHCSHSVHSNGWW